MRDVILVLLIFAINLQQCKAWGRNWVSPYSTYQCSAKPAFLKLKNTEWCQIHESLHQAVLQTGLAKTLGYNKAMSTMFGLIQKESSFRAKVIGKAGEIGLTQIKPATARFICQINKDDLFEIEQNLNCSAKYLNLLLGKEYFNHDLEMALIAYNQGWGKVKKGLFSSQDRLYAKLIVEKYSPSFQ